MKNIKKLYPLIVGLVLLISVAAYGTRAYFSDSTKEDAGIDLTLGDVEITPEGENWQYITNKESINTNLKNKDGKEFNSSKMGTKIALIDARPGDSFSKIFKFKNTGSLLQLVTFETTKNAPSIFKVTWEKINNDTKEVGGELSKNDSFELESEGTMSLKMTVSVTLDEGNEEQHDADGSANNSKKTTDVNQLMEETITVNAVQTNLSQK